MGRNKVRTGREGIEEKGKTGKERSDKKKKNR